MSSKVQTQLLKKPQIIKVQKSTTKIQFTLLAGKSRKALKTKLKSISEEKAIHLSPTSPEHSKVCLILEKLYVQHDITRIGKDRYQFTISEEATNNEVGEFVLSYLNNNLVNIFQLYYDDENVVHIIAGFYKEKPSTKDLAITELNPKELKLV